MKRSAAAVSLALGLLVAAATRAHPAAAQGRGAGDQLRLGVSFGGVSTVALNVELVQDARSLDLALGTWSFHDVSISAVVKQYFGAGSAQPVVGAGLWAVAAAPGEGRTGWALVLRVPIGVDWEVVDRHAVGLFLDVDRGLWVRRSDPEDDLPLNRRLVPLPEAYYRYTR